MNDYKEIQEDTVSNAMKVWLARFILKRGKGARNLFYMNGGGKRWTVDGVEQIEPGYKISKMHRAYVLDMKIHRKRYLGLQSFRDMLRADFPFVHFVPNTTAMDGRGVLYAINSPAPAPAAKRQREEDDDDRRREEDFDDE